ncbi:MAG: hypothetical protein ABI456_01715 [Ktedonobacteraceae bacterium]|nr:hypothetical protein [Chloroflexota bacterium]
MQHEQPALEYDGYQGNQPLNQASSVNSGSSPQGDMYGDYRGSQEKLQPDQVGGVPAGMRLGLAIVSVVMLSVLAMNIVNSSTISAGSYVILGIVALTVLIINVVFNRWWFPSWG